MASNEDATDKTSEYRFFPSKNGQNESSSSRSRTVNFNVNGGGKKASVKRFNKANISRGNFSSVKRTVRKKGQVNTTLLRASFRKNNGELARALAVAKADAKVLTASLYSLQRENAELLKRNAELMSKREVRSEAIQGLVKSVSQATELIHQMVDTQGVIGEWVTKLAANDDFDENSNISHSEPSEREVRPVEDDRSSDIFVAPDRANSIYAIKPKKDAEPSKAPLLSKPKENQPIVSSKEKDNSEDPGPSSADSRPVRSKNRPAKVQPDLSILMETSVVGITDEPSVDFDNVLPTSPELDTVCETEEPNSDDGPSNKIDPKPSRRTITIQPKPRRNSSLLGRASGVSLVGPSRMSAAARVDKETEEIRRSRTPSPVKQPESIPKEKTVVSKGDKKSVGGVKPKTAAKAIRPPSKIPQKASTSAKETKATRSSNSTLVLHTPLKLDRSRSKSPFPPSDVEEVQRTGESPPIRPMDPSIYQKAYVEAASPERYCPSEGSIHLHIDESEEEEMTPTKNNTEDSEDGANIPSPSTMKVANNAAANIRRDTFVVNANRTIYDDSTMDLTQDGDNSRDSEDMAVVEESQPTIDTATVVKKPKRKSIEISDDEEDVVVANRNGKKRATKIIFDSDDDGDIDTGVAKTAVPKPTERKWQRTTAAAAANLTDPNLESSAEEQEVMSKKQGKKPLKKTTKVPVADKAEVLMKSMTPIEIRVVKMDLNSPDVQLLLGKEKAVASVVQPAIEVEQSDTEMSDADVAVVEEPVVTAPKPRKRKESVSQPKVRKSALVPKPVKSSKSEAAKADVPSSRKKLKSLMPSQRDTFDLTMDETQPIQKFVRGPRAADPPPSPSDSENVEIPKTKRPTPIRKSSAVDLEQVFNVVESSKEEENQSKTKKAGKESMKAPMSRKVSTSRAANSKSAAVATVELTKKDVEKKRRITKRLASADSEASGDDESVASVSSSVRSDSQNRPSSSRSGMRDSGVEDDSGRSRRRATAAVSYKEPSLNMKMRR